MKKFLFVGLAVLVALLGCNLFNRDFYRTADDFPGEGQGVLVLVFDSDAIPTKTLEPGIVMEANAYDIEIDDITTAGVDPDYTYTDEPGPVLTETLDAGTDRYTVLVKVKNAVGGTVVGAIRGDETEEDTFSIAAGFVPNQVTVEVVPLITGTGELDISIAWPSGSLTDPHVTAYLVPSSGDPSDPTSDSSWNISDDSTTSPRFTIDNASTYDASYNNASLTPGYYTLMMTFSDDSSPLWGLTEAVRIIQDQTTPSNSPPTWTLSPAGDLDLTIEYDLYNPYTITVPAPASVAQNNDLTVTANADGSLADTVPADYSYEWNLYIDGEHTGVSNTYAAGATGASSSGNLTYGIGALAIGTHNAIVTLEVSYQGAVQTISSGSSSFAVTE